VVPFSEDSGAILIATVPEIEDGPSQKPRRRRNATGYRYGSYMPSVVHLKLAETMTSMVIKVRYFYHGTSNENDASGDCHK
jgi:hypothetical protein